MKRHRPERIGELLKEELSEIVNYELRDRRVGVVTITHVKVSSDLKHAKVYVSLLGSDEEVRQTIAVLNHAAQFMRHQLYPRLHLRFVPELTFAYDDSIAKAARIDDLLHEIAEQKARAEPEKPE